MNLRLVFKIISLLFALGATIYAIYALNSKHSSDFLTSVGFGSRAQSLNWCSNRLTKMTGAVPEMPWILEETNQQWTISVGGEAPKRLEYLDIEKWLAKYCTLDIQIHRGEDMLEERMRPFATAQFNDGQMAKIYRLNDNIFQINEVIFKSDEMQAAIKDLEGLLKL